jgi:hypothetical protein
MPNPICEKCKADRPEEETSFMVKQTGCNEQYAVVDKCMKQNRGNIASCSTEWDGFQACMKKSKEENK